MYELGIMYEQCGGKKGTMNFNYKVPGLPLELGLRRINNECPDTCICDLENQYRGLDLPIEIYVEEMDCEPIQALDQEGNVVSTQQEEEMRCLLDGVDFGDDLGFTAPRGDGEGRVGEQGHDGDGECQENEMDRGSKLILKKLEGSNPPIFDKMYVCLSALKNGFLGGCRPIICLDGCFLKTCYGGQLLVVVGRDGNDNMFPIAMVVVQVENRKNWT
ncbi:hypothetical protein Sango_1588700 [Sesamum angolense]|uniref:MULE transposase domain-containing protein n=1 Tax=Sesamum angolense TaxID=2727404 RepID=A0AAE2BTT3_9LAMI|nr:hypothetical protein Sango_1588700 [Sesamum angolense]